MRVLDSPFPAYSTGTGDTMSEFPATVIMDRLISKNPKKIGFYLGDTIDGRLVDKKEPVWNWMGY